MTAPAAVGVLVASDKWKGSLSSATAGQHIATGLRRALPRTRIRVLPVADGGDGSVAAAVSAGFEARRLHVVDGAGQRVTCTTAWRGAEVVLEVAQLGGMAGGRPQPMDASSHAVGHALRAVVEQGARRVVVALGGSASTDGGAGMLQALGARLLDRAGRVVHANGGTLHRIVTAELSTIRGLDGVELVAACDVDNGLLGHAGAARVFGPQKGADADQVEALEKGLAHWRDVTTAGPGDDRSVQPGAGASGGTGYGLLLVGAQAVGGADFFLDLVGFDTALESSQLVVTGEGRLDAQSLAGKLPVVVARRARPRTVVAVVGTSQLTPADAASVGITDVLALDSVADPARAMADPAYTARSIERLALQLAHRNVTHAPPPPAKE